MAKLSGPLLSESAHGKLAQILTYSKRRALPIVRDYRIPRKDITLKQWTQRHIIGLLTAQWQCKSAAEKLVYENLAKASGLQIPGFNYFIKVAQHDLYTHHGLCAYWSMNEAAGAQITDYSGNGNHGTLLPTYPTDCPTRIASIQKEYGNALRFDAATKYMDGTNGDRLKINDILTVEFWLKGAATQSPAWQSILSKSNGGGRGWRINCYDTGPYFYMQIKTSISDNEWGGYLASLDNLWHHQTWVLNTGAYKSYIDGNLIDAGAYGHGDGFDAPDVNFYIKYSNITPGFDIDELRIYNRELSLAEIKKHYELLRLNKKRQPLLIH